MERPRRDPRWRPKPAEISRISTESITDSMSDVVGVSDVELKRYLAESCDTIRVGNTEVIVARQEHKSPVPAALLALAEAPRTKALLVEYFKPEIRANARKFPLLGWFFSRTYTGGPDEKKKHEVSDALVEVAKETGKPIATADIANGPDYYYGYTVIPPIVGSLAVKFLAPQLAIPIVGMWVVNRWQEIVTHQGFFNKKHISGMERIMLDTEDARRVFVARGARQIAEQHSSDDGQPNRILICYPEAHARRIADYISNDHKGAQASRLAKEKLYRLIPKVDIAVRQYVWTGEKSTTPHPIQPGRGAKKQFEIEQAMAGWERISHTRI